MAVEIVNPYVAVAKQKKKHIAYKKSTTIIEFGDNARPRPRGYPPPVLVCLALAAPATRLLCQSYLFFLLQFQNSIPYA